jgi:hypothetical protein
MVLQFFDWSGESPEHVHVGGFGRQYRGKSSVGRFAIESRAADARSGQEVSDWLHKSSIALLTESHIGANHLLIDASKKVVPLHIHRSADSHTIIGCRRNKSRYEKLKVYFWELIHLRYVHDHCIGRVAVFSANDSPKLRAAEPFLRAQHAALRSTAL